MANHRTARAKAALRATNTPTTPALLTAYADALRATCDPDLLRAGWCIQATRVAVLAFEAFDVRAEAVAVYLECSNPAAAALAGAYRGPVPVGQRPVVWPCGRPNLRNAPCEPHIWDGHMAALVDGRHLIDAAVSQCRNPCLGIETPDILVASEVALSAAGWRHSVRVRSGGEFTDFDYTRLRHDPRAFRFAAWRSETNHSHAARVVAQMRAALALRAA